VAPRGPIFAIRRVAPPLGTLSSEGSARSVSGFSEGWEFPIERTTVLPKIAAAGALGNITALPTWATGALAPEEADSLPICHLPVPRAPTSFERSSIYWANRLIHPARSKQVHRTAVELS
jgi:hypothetical protein